jgi:hypothetical protein
VKAVANLLGEDGIGVPGKYPDLVVHDRPVTFQSEKMISGQGVQIRNARLPEQEFPEMKIFTISSHQSQSQLQISSGLSGYRYRK